MTISLRADPSGSYGAVQLNGSDVLTFDSTGIALGSERTVKSISASVAANALTLAIAACSLEFRSATLTNGAVTRANVGALSLVVPSGATLGTNSAQQALLLLLVAYNAGSPVLCVVNLAGGLDLSETGLISPTTISAGATSASTIYSASAVAANSPYRVVGFTQITEPVAGVWSVDRTLVQGIGGQALTSLQSLGYGQTWQNVIGSRVFGTTYYNTTSKPIVVSIYGNPATGATGFSAQVNGVGISAISVSTAGATVTVSFIVPPGCSYSVSAGSTISAAVWAELR